MYPKLKQLLWQNALYRVIILPVGNHFFIHRFKGEFALGYVAENGRDDTDNSVPHGLVDHGQAIGEYLNEHISKEYKSNSGEGIAEELYTAMQVRLGKNNMTRHNKACRETDGKCNDPRAYLGRDNEAAIDRERKALHYIIERKIFYKYIKYGIRPSTGEVTESLGWYPPGNRAMKKIYKPNYDMSGL